MTEAKEPFSGESTKQAVKPLRREGRDAPPVPVCSCASSCHCANGTRDRGCGKHPVFPAPSDQRAANFPASLGRNRREIAKVYPPSLRAQRSNPLLRKHQDGLLRCARNDADRPAADQRGKYR